MSNIVHARAPVKKKSLQVSLGGRGCRPSTCIDYTPSSPVGGLRQEKNPPENADIRDVGGGLPEASEKRAGRALDSFIKRHGKERALLPVHRGALEAFGFAALEAVAGCKKDVLLFRCEKCGWATIVPSGCKLRFCPICLQSDVADFYVDRLPVVSNFESPSHLVLSGPNVRQGELRWAVGELQKGLYRLKRSGVWQKKVPRAFVAWGLTWNAQAQSWNHHLHAIIDAPWVPRGKLMEAARRAFRLELPPNLYVKRARGDPRGLWDEVFKGSQGDAAALMELDAVLVGEARVAFHRRYRWWFLGDYPPAVRQGDDLPIEHLEYLRARHHCECALCRNPVSSSDWFKTSGPNRAPDLRAREIGGFREVSQGEHLERMALEEKNRP
ncbi:unnamed protein product, partial [marine sediment metagenome]